MVDHIFILVPSFIPAGPVKGAVALANSLVTERSVTLVSLKGGSGCNSPIDKNVRVIDLSNEKSLLKRISRYKQYLTDAGVKSQVASISYTFSADMVNILCRQSALTCSSVRGNLLQNYKMEYGYPGIGLAFLHLLSLRIFHKTVVMSDAMQSNVYFYTRKIPVKIPNFIDESSIEHFRRKVDPSSPIRFVFVGSLTSRKQPLLLLSALKKLESEGYLAYLDIVGDGPLKESIEQKILALGLNERVVLHGHLKSPYSVVASANIFVLPSLSEGLSRASLEALHLGLPCVMREVDGNSEFITHGKNGFLFKSDDDLSDTMIQSINLVKDCDVMRTSLLPEQCRQKNAALQYLFTVEEI